jgi:putative transposase
MSSLSTSVFVLPTAAQYCSSSSSSKSSILKSNRFFIALYRKYVYNANMKARHQYRFYPTAPQRLSLAQLFGCVRVVWNDALAFCKTSEKLPGYNKLSAMLTQIKKTEERQWLKGVSSVPLQQSLRHLAVAYKNFFDSCSGKRKGKKLGSPKFKKKTNHQSAEFTKAAFSIIGTSVYLAKIGDIAPIWSRELPSDPSSVTVIKDGANRYFLSFVVEIEAVAVAPINLSVGIDLGLKTFAVLSTGEAFKSPDYSKLDRKVRKRQRQLARQEKGSNRRHKTRLSIARLHNQVSDLRKDFLHQLSTKVVRENQAITLEDLNVSGMIKNRKLSRAIRLQGWREFRELCKAKSEKFGRQLQTVSRWEPTSQICSNCGYRWGKLDLKVRTVPCLSCGTTHDRDENAAKNIDKVGIGHCHDSKRTQRDSKTTSR